MRLEDVMAGLFGGTEAPGADPRRRDRERAGQGSGYGGIAGGAVSLADMLPHLRGLPSYDYSGAFARDFGGGGARGLADLVGPSARHLQRQGGDFGGQGGPPPQAAQDFLPPGQALGGPPGQVGGFGPPGQEDLPPGIDQRNAIGGANIAPGQQGRGEALYQGARPQGAGRVAPHTQGWLNVAPGYGVAARFGYGTPEFDRAFGVSGRGPAGSPMPPGQGGGESAGGGGGKNVSGGPGGGGGASAPAPAPTAGPKHSAGANIGGGGGGGAKGPGLNPKAGKKGPARSSSGKPGGTTNTSGGRGGAKANVNPSKVLPGKNNIGLITVPNRGNNNTPTELQGGSVNKGTPKPVNNTTPSELQKPAPAPISGSVKPKKSSSTSAQQR
jgi:hypothetical protein